MNFNKKILILFIFIFFIFITASYSAFNHENINEIQTNANNNELSDLFGCCSIVLQLEDSNTLMSYRRDSNFTADVKIEQGNWHNKSVIKQYKTDEGYFSHVIITSDGWVIGLGGTDDGIDNEKCENITAKMISDDYSISKSDLAKIQDIKKPYGRGHVLIKAPNGNYGFATINKIKTGHIEPGQYISMPNDYSYSRAGNLSLDTPDKIKAMNELAQSDKYGLDRREIITYDFKVGKLINQTEIYVSNEDGSQLGVDYTGCIDDVYVNNSVIKAEDIPIAPNYKHIGSFEFINNNSNSYKLTMLLSIVVFVVGVSLISFASYKFVKFIKFKIRR